VVKLLARMFIELIKTQLKSHKLRTILTIAGVVIGVFLITSMVALSESVSVSVEEGMGFMSGKIYILEAGGDASIMNMMGSEFDESLVTSIEDFDGIDRVAPMIYGQATLGLLTGMDWEYWDMFEGFGIGFQYGGPYADGANEIVVGSLVYETQGYTTGDIIRIRDKPYEVVGVFKSFGNPGDDSSYFTSLDTAQDVLGKEGKIMAMLAEPYDPDNAEEIAEAIEEEYDEIIALVDKDLQRTIEELMGQIRAMTIALGGIASIISAIVIMNVMFMNVRERTKEIGTMKAVGATDRQVLLMIIGEAMFIALIGGVIGLALSFITVQVVNAAIGSRLAVVTLRLALQSLAFAAFLGVVGGALPARKAAELEPVVALRYE